MKEVKITCDDCSYDLTTTGNCEDYRIAVTNESIPPFGNTVTAMAVSQKLDKNLHFCDQRCLKHYFEIHDTN